VRGGGGHEAQPRLAVDLLREGRGETQESDVQIPGLDPRQLLLISLDLDEIDLDPLFREVAAVQCDEKSGLQGTSGEANPESASRGDSGSFE
jgi:hypothetical protein